VIALMYHDIVAPDAEDASGFRGRDAAIYKVAPGQFQAHLQAIASRVPLRARPDCPALALTFDDGGASAMEAAAALERHSMIGWFFVTTNYIGTPGFLDRGRLRELRSRGHIVGSHSCSHPLRMGRCSWHQLVDEWTRSRDLLGALLDEPVEAASVPGGDFTPRVAQAAAQAGFRRLFTSEPIRGERRSYGISVVGRFTIQRWTDAKTAAALAARDWLPCTRQAILWNAKKLTKRIGGDHYLRLRQRLLGHGNEVQWGDR
jgi:peptidoglycan/xylan/chitin deacetylase (PgdA/CDA1 family)